MYPINLLGSTNERLFIFYTELNACAVNATSALSPAIITMQCLAALACILMLLHIS